jgi:hypothetical protein
MSLSRIPLPPERELEPGQALVADHPPVVARLDDMRRARSDLDLGAVVLGTGFLSSLARFRARDRP